MKAIFVHKHVVLRDSHVDPGTPPEMWQLVPATLEAMRMLATADTLVFLFGSQDETGGSQTSEGERDHGSEILIRQIEAGGGRVDGVVVCPHRGSGACKCWGEFPGVFWVPASQFGLRLEECYVLGDTQKDIVSAYAAGARPLLILCARSIGDVFGDLPDHKDFPIATNLTAAVDYIGVEEEITRQLGHPRNMPVSMPSPEALFADSQALPTFTITSRLAHSLQARVLKTRAQLRDLGRWLSFFILGALGLSLGIAYLLTHLYRVQPFPDFVYYVTLQFIPRPLRGALFIVWGMGVIFLAIRSFYRSTNIWRRRRP